mmetsp:Transcript_569/g.862  ORF Transcript_569/g.862 Transcript_569/m.862 type:complete len:88 (+) Transcript_569:1694-1957(+)
MRAGEDRGAKASDGDKAHDKTTMATISDDLDIIHVFELCRSDSAAFSKGRCGFRLCGREVGFALWALGSRSLGHALCLRACLTMLVE